MQYLWFAIDMLPTYIRHIKIYDVTKDTSQNKPQREVKRMPGDETVTYRNIMFALGT